MLMGCKSVQAATRPLHISGCAEPWPVYNIANGCRRTCVQGMEGPVGLVHPWCHTHHSTKCSDSSSDGQASAQHGDAQKRGKAGQLKHHAYMTQHTSQSGSTRRCARAAVPILAKHAPQRKSVAAKPPTQMHMQDHPPQTHTNTHASDTARTRSYRTQTQHSQRHTQAVWRCGK
jgi:hypothetical protein